MLCNIDSKYFELHEYPLVFKLLPVTNIIFVNGRVPHPVENRGHCPS